MSWTLEDRRDLDVLMEILKIIHGFKSFNYIELFTKRRYIGFSRHEHTFEVSKCRLNIKNFFL